MELRFPKLRTGTYFPGFLEPPHGGESSMPTFTFALLPMVRMKSFILSFWRANTYTTEGRIFERRPVERPSTQASCQ